ncbi:MAG TPA: hypothetical protein VG097_07585, partial [Gemmata sp.]|nr:hypothetical protein [Gemmata sp.]
QPFRLKKVLKYQGLSSLFASTEVNPTYLLRWGAMPTPSRGAWHPFGQVACDTDAAFVELE